jgi:hypothetical protein
MILSFLPDVHAFDPQDQLIRFLALDGQRVVRCAVSRRALEQAEGLAPGATPLNLLHAFHHHQERLRALASWKYENGQSDAAGSVTIRAGDIGARASAAFAASRQAHFKRAC